VHLERAGKAAPLARIGLRYDGNDALVEAADSALGRARFEYDPAGPLVRASGAAPEEFEYDGAGNLVRHGRQGYEYDAANRLVGGAGLACRHDGDGNLVQEETPEGVRRFTYDALGLLTRAELPGGVNAEYGYDPFGRRLWKRVQDAGGRCTETRWVWAGDQPLSETVTDDEGDTVEARDFLFLPGSFTPLAQRVDGAVFCCHTDSRGAPTRLTDGQGRLAWAAAYAAYGQAHVRREGVRQPLRLPGQYHDEETGLHQNRWRPYDPSRGRYLSPDPLGLAGGLNPYAYASNDPIGQADPLGLFPSLAQLIGSHLGPQAARKYLSARGGVTQAVLDHLGPLRRLLPPASPRPPDPALSLAHPQNHLPPAPAARQAASPQAPHRAPQAPRPAKGVHSCPEARTAPLPSDETPLLTWHDLGTGLWTGLRRVYDFRRGTQQASEDMVNPLKIYQAAHGLGDQLATLVPGADGQKAAPGTLARSMGHGFIDGINPFNKKSAYDTGQATANAASVIVPGLGEAGALNDLRLGLRAANLGRAAAEAGLRAAEGTPGEAAAVARLKAAEEQVAQARAALRGKIPGAGARRAVRQAGEKAQRARAAVAKYRERKAAGGRDPHDPWAKHTDESLRKAEKDAAGLHDRWHGGGKGAGQGQPAVAHAGGGKTSRPIGRPSLVQRMIGKSKVGERPTLSKRIKDNKQSPADVAPVVSTPVTYGEFDLSKKAIEFRRTYKNPKTGKVGYWGTSNIAVFEYMNPQGELETLAVKSKPFVEHSEPIGLLELEKRGISFDKVERVYTERQPCSTNSKNCDTLLASELPGKPVFHSFEYGADEASQQAGNRALAKALRKWQKETKQ